MFPDRSTGGYTRFVLDVHMNDFRYTNALEPVPQLKQKTYMNEDGKDIEKHLLKDLSVVFLYQTSYC